MNKEIISLIVWAGVFLLFELTAVFWSACPWYTLSGTVWMGETWWWPIGLMVALFMFVLFGHFEWHWTSRWLIAIAIGTCAVIVSHLISQVVMHAQR